MRVLVVEDDVKMAALLRRGLQHEGYAVDVVSTGRDALWAATEFPVDAVVLDVMIPCPDGFEVCRRLREEGLRAPILMLTARDAVVDRVRGLDTGADDYLVKPFAFEELFARLRSLLRRDAGERAAVLQVGDLRLDPGSKVVSRGGQCIPLSVKEFTILELFMRQPGKVLSRRLILDHAWDFAYDGTSNVVEVYVRYLRDKVDRPFGEASIETVRGHGYRLRAQ
ncbi:MAG: response regulator transcription factor [Actinobacteria bacterium]|nr:response regulator transcription factor [Actinomycetota bacterium]MBW3648927.1 response regulator transcription factor [Actinomycetota bacterium]